MELYWNEETNLWLLGGTSTSIKHYNTYCVSNMKWVRIWWLGFLPNSRVKDETLMDKTSYCESEDSRFFKPGVVACTCNPATLEADFRNGVGSIPVVGNGFSVSG